MPLQFNIETLRELVATPKNAIIVTHTNPDGDAIGSSLGLYHFLLNRGFEVSLIAPTDYASYLHFLPQDDHVLIYPANPKAAIQRANEAQLLFCLDFNTYSRLEGLGKILSALQIPKILIDHHLEPEQFDYYVWNTQASSTAELVHFFIDQIGASAEITPDIATCLYTGLASDTGRFMHSLSANVFACAAQLHAANANVQMVNNQLFNSYSLDRLQLWGHSIAQRMVVLPEYQTAYIYLTKADFEQFNHQIGDTDGIVNLPLQVSNIRFAALFRDEKEKVKISFRSKGNFSVNDFARLHFNGGGHFNAAGGSSVLNLQESIDKFLQVLPLYKKSLNAE